MFEPLHDFVLLSEVKPEETEGGIIIADGDREPTNQATVISIGPNAGGIVNQGDVVYIKKFAFQEISDGKTPYLIGRLGGIIAKYVAPNA